MVNKVIKKAAAYVLSATLVFGVFAAAGMGAPVDVQAARKKVKTIKFKKKGYVLSKKGKTINLSKQLTFNPKKPNTKRVSYKTSSKKVATVSSKGIVKAKKNGTVTITAISKSNKKAKATTKITVGKGVKSLKFKEGTKRTVKVTEGFYLHPVYSPGNATTRSVTYKSSNTKVATVSSKGYVSAKAPGTAKITAVCKDAYGKSAAINITVPACVTGVSLDYTKLQMKKGESDQSLTAAVKGSASGVTYKWTSSNSKVAAVSGNGKSASVKAVGTGSATIRLEAYNLNNAAKNHKFACCTVSVGTVSDQTITAGGTYDHVRRNVTVAGTATGTVNLNDANIDTLRLYPGNYTLNVNNCNIKSVITLSEKKSETRTLQPVINLSGTTVKKAEISFASSIALKTDDTYVSNLVLNTGGVGLATENGAEFRSVTIATSEPVALEAAVNKLVLTGASEMMINSDVRNLILDCSTGKPIIKVTSAGVVNALEITRQTKEADVSGEGKVNLIKITDIADLGSNKINIVLDQGTKVQDESGTTKELQSFEKVEGISDNGMTTFILDSNAYKYQIKKGNHISYVEQADLDKLLKYMGNPSGAYEKWMELTGTYTDFSGIITVKADANHSAVKIVSIKGTDTRDGEYKVKLEKKESGTEYIVTVSYLESSRPASVIEVSASGSTVKAESSKFIATAKVDGSEFVLIDKKSGNTLVKTVKENKSYKVSIETSKAGDIAIAQQLIK